MSFTSDACGHKSASLTVQRRLAKPSQLLRRFKSGIDAPCQGSWLCRLFEMNHYAAHSLLIPLDDLLEYRIFLPRHISV
jgi:hypothetical protein